MVSGTKMLAADPLSPVSCAVEPPWSGLSGPAHPTDAGLDSRSRIWRPSQHLELVVVLDKKTMKSPLPSANTVT